MLINKHMFTPMIVNSLLLCCLVISGGRGTRHMVAGVECAVP